MSKKILVYGVGINDADYAVQPMVNGKQARCPYYVAWKNMLARCCSEVEQSRRPKYIGCAVCEEWLTFSNFKKWMERQDFEGKALDKDILISGNKVYSPDACVFVSKAVNALLTDSGASRGKYKQGVSWNKHSNKFQSEIRIYGVKKVICYCDTEQEAYSAYVAAKAAHIREVADTQEQKVRAGLYRHAAELEKTLEEVDLCQ